MICVDASVAFKWIVEEEWSAKALHLYDAAQRSGEAIVAPPLMPLEVTNTLRQRMRSRIIPTSLAGATVLLEDFLALRYVVLDPPGLLQRALALADTFDLPAVYDAHYVALTEWLGCELWTADQQLLGRVERGLPYVRWIGDYGEH